MKDKEIKVVEIEVGYTLVEPEKGSGMSHGTTCVVYVYLCRECPRVVGSGESGSTSCSVPDIYTSHMVVHRRYEDGTDWCCVPQNPKDGDLKDLVHVIVSSFVYYKK